MLIEYSTIHQKYNAEKAMIVSRHGFSILNVSLLHHLPHLWNIFVQDKRFDFRIFKTILHRAICVCCVVNTHLSYCDLYFNTKFWRNNHRDFKYQLFSVKLFYNNHHASLKWSANAFATVNVRNLSETFLEVIPENVQINSRQRYFQNNLFFPARKHL